MMLKVVKNVVFGIGTTVLKGVNVNNLIVYNDGAKKRTPLGYDFLARVRTWRI